MSHDDQKFFDLFTLIIGLLIGIAFGIFLVASSMGDEQAEVAQADPFHQDLVIARLSPVGRVTTDGEARISSAPAPAAAVQTQAPMTGPEVYEASCAMCHDNGTGGAPKRGDKAAWAERIAQDEAVITEHVLKGFSGNAGYMPPKGGRVDLSDEEILAAMHYLLDEAS